MKKIVDSYAKEKNWILVETDSDLDLSSLKQKICQLNKKLNCLVQKLNINT